MARRVVKRMATGTSAKSRISRAGPQSRPRTFHSEGWRMKMATRFATAIAATFLLLGAAAPLHADQCSGHSHTTGTVLGAVGGGVIGGAVTHGNIGGVAGG